MYVVEFLNNKQLIMGNCCNDSSR